VFTRTRWNLVLSALFVLAAGACGSAGGCGACSTVQPLPGGKLPADQTVEGGAQLRVTPHGIATITTIVKPLLDQQLANGFCLPGGDAIGGIVAFCETNQGPCNNGCLITPTLDGVSLGPHPTDPTLLRAHLNAHASATVPLHIVAGTCDVPVHINNLVADIDVSLGIDAASGELGIHANPITNFSFTDSFDNPGGVCVLISGLATIIDDIAHSTIVDFVRGLLSPAIGNTIDTLVPSPLGLAGVMNVGNLLAGLSQNTQAQLETRLLPGGYAHMRNGGLSVGIITGINADRDPSTRGPGMASQPALCVPALPVPNLGVAPSSLPKTTRSTYRLDPANEFDGVPDPTTDVAIGVSEAALDLAGHHLVTSGALCLQVGTSFVPQLNLSTIGIFVRSLGKLASSSQNDPVLLVTRPQRALDFTIGDNTATSPALTIGIEHLEVDFYVFLYERYVRAFTLDLSLNAGINLAFEQAPGQPAQIRPMLLGVDSDHVKLVALNSEFVKETPEELQAVLPSVFNLVTPLLGRLPTIGVPPIAGFALDNLSVRHVTTAQDDFLGIYGTLGASTLSQLVGAPLIASAAPQPPSMGTARLVSVTTPEPERIRDALLHQPDGALPRVTFDVDERDAAGRELEWSYQLDGGLWRMWRRGAPLVIEDPAFVWQGKYTIGLMSRVVGDYHTVSAPIQVPVIIDSVAPHIAVDQAAWSGDTYRVPAFDSVSGDQLQYAFGRPGQGQETTWSSGGTIELQRDVAEAYRDDHGQVAVFVRDEAGNTAGAVLVPLAQAPVGCSVGGGAGGGLLLGVAGLLIVGAARHRRRSRRAIAHAAAWLSAVVATALVPGCNCGAAPAAVCESMADCTLPCPMGLNFCVDSACTCSPDLLAGRIGPYSDLAVAPDGGIWVSAYAQSHGDLVVARTTGGRIADTDWEWVDGVPAGPVMVPGSKIRGGINDNGPDVGMYTSIAVGADGTPMVSYYDRDTASLKLAQRINGAWQIHIVDKGTGKLPATGNGALVGMYTSLTLRSDDGRPGIAYLAHVADQNGRHAEVRFASAQLPHPTTAGDWQFWVVDTAPLPPDDPNNPALFPLPDGLGLFIDSARQPNQAPVVVYYDRANGDLKLSKFNAQAGQFAAARVLDGSNGVDAGWSPSVAVDAQGVVNVAYVGATADDLKFVTDATGAMPAVIDDGYRIDGQTVDGQPRPVFHFVGADAGLVLPPGGPPMVVYQDATTQELLLGQQQPGGMWKHVSIAGATDPWPGGYGFFAAGALGKNQIAMSSWVINLPASDDANASWVEVFTRPLTSQ
jgi:hypothetical protein